MVHSLVKDQILRSIETKQKIADDGELLDTIVAAGRMTARSLQKGGKIMICGNGGSAGDAQHIAAELVVRYKGGNERKALPAMSLCVDPSIITACGNDYGYDQVFARQIEAFGKPDDCVLGITTSGNSRNIELGFEEARRAGVRTILLTGSTGGAIYQNRDDLVDICIRVPSDETARIQESHIMIGQILCSLIEKELFDLD
ncbi:MAG: D-sedoheptulose 7-phosphate isomerase [Leptospiraceae bacterium]|nr:D-sedoheptulose 7-phosphate isomerase [Leptospiraceae bacterium]MCB1305320.1 D-sedoheptulose 7-phosphate isomerase [Leptospiraceae bacterium]